MTGKYRVLEDEELANNDYSDDFTGKVLVGPNGFECVLGEPEDCNWYRDGGQVVTELNRLLEQIKEVSS